MFDKEEEKKIREIIREEIKTIGIVKYIDEETEKSNIKDEITEVKSDLTKYNNELNLYSIEYRLGTIERLILNLEKVNKILLKLVLGLFIVSMILLVSFIVMNLIL
jgi:hypothetical protein